jgi:hypothetical protein
VWHKNAFTYIFFIYYLLIYLFTYLVVPGIETKASQMLEKYCTPEIHPIPKTNFFLFNFQFYFLKKIVVPGGGMLSHLQKLLQCIKYIILELTNGRDYII